MQCALYFGCSARFFDFSLKLPMQNLTQRIHTHAMWVSCCDETTKCQPVSYQRESSSNNANQNQCESLSLSLWVYSVYIRYTYQLSTRRNIIPKNQRNHKWLYSAVDVHAALFVIMNPLHMLLCVCVCIYKLVIIFIMIALCQRCTLLLYLLSTC